jgi:hypothetical protein
VVGDDGAATSADFLLASSDEVRLFLCRLAGLDGAVQ